MTKRQEQAQASRRKIFETAKGLIGEKGYQNVTISQIVQACGMSVGNFYHYFSSKDEVILYVERSLYDQLDQCLDAMEERPLEEKLRYYFREWAKLMVEDYGPNFNRQWIAYHAMYSASTKKAGEKNKIDESAATIQKFLETAIEKGELCPATPTEELARLMVFAEFGALLYFCMTDGKFDLLQWAVDYSGTMKDTLLAPYWKGSESPTAP